MGEKESLLYLILNGEIKYYNKINNSYIFILSNKNEI
jgi:hypothetical protein